MKFFKQQGVRRKIPYPDAAAARPRRKRFSDDEEAKKW